MQFTTREAAVYAMSSLTSPQGSNGIRLKVNWAERPLHLSVAGGSGGMCILPQPMQSYMPAKYPHAANYVSMSPDAQPWMAPVTAADGNGGWLPALYRAASAIHDSSMPVVEHAKSTSSPPRSDDSGATAVGVAGSYSSASDPGPAVSGAGATDAGPAQDIGTGKGDGIIARSTSNSSAHSARIGTTVHTVDQSLQGMSDQENRAQNNSPPRPILSDGSHLPKSLSPSDRAAIRSRVLSASKAVFKDHVVVQRRLQECEQDDDLEVLLHTSGDEAHGCMHTVDQEVFAMA